MRNWPRRPPPRATLTHHLKTKPSNPMLQQRRPSNTAPPFLTPSNFFDISRTTGDICERLQETLHTRKRPREIKEEATKRSPEPTILPQATLPQIGAPSPNSPTPTSAYIPCLEAARAWSTGELGFSGDDKCLRRQEVSTIPIPVPDPDSRLPVHANACQPRVRPPTYSRAQEAETTIHSHLVHSAAPFVVLTLQTPPAASYSPANRPFAQLYPVSQRQRTHKSVSTKMSASRPTANLDSRATTTKSGSDIAKMER
ncbi:hypothetical protein AB1N83_012368 [Pleurotus pulmonarius]